MKTQDLPKAFAQVNRKEPIQISATQCPITARAMPRVLANRLLADASRTVLLHCPINAEIRAAR